MVEITMKYLGDLRVEARHGPSGTTIVTDAPVDNMGKGESFSPSDLTATSLGACMLTIMGIVAQRQNIDISGTTVRVEKHMITEPARRIGRLVVEFHIPNDLSADDRKRLENAAHTCPVHKSLHPDIQIDVTFRYGA